MVSKKRFTHTIKTQLDTEKQSRTRARLATIVSIFSKTTNLILLLLVSLVISLIWQRKLAVPYLTSQRPIGGDYFNALTYAQFFAQHKPFPSTGWMPFWNGGLPVIGGYPSLFFYALLPLTKLFDVPTSMELASVVLLLIYLIASHFLFWEVSRSHLLSSLFTLVIIFTPATYYSLTAEGLVIASAMQWLLPTSLFFLVRFVKFVEPQMLVFAAATTGLALLFHPGVATFTVFLPTFLYLLIADTGDPKDAFHSQQLRLIKRTFWQRLKTKARHLGIFLAFTATIGSVGIYILLMQTVFAVGSGRCDSPQCWGDYPQHFIWLSPFLLVPLVFLPLTLIAWRVNKAHFSQVAAPLAAFLPLALYIIAARLHLVDTLTSAFFPRRIFWAAALLLLTACAASFRYITKASAKLTVTAIALFLIVLSLTTPLFLPNAFRFSLQRYTAFPNTIPMQVESYITPKYQTLPSEEVLPSWLPLDDGNHRLESIRPDFYIWWNTVSQMPSTRGYSNSPTREHVNWIYYLQSATLIPQTEEELSQETRRNRALFLLDAFAVSLIQQPAISVLSEGIAYDPLLLTDKTLISRSQPVLNSWSYYQLNDKLITPIVSPTNAARVLVVTDQPGFETLIRAVSLVNLNSKLVIPIQGPPSIDKLRPEVLSSVDAVLLYQFKGKQWTALENYLQSGGKLFVDLGSLDNIPNPPPEFLATTDLTKTTVSGEWKLKAVQTSPLLKEVDINKFAPPIFENAPWKLIAPTGTTNLKTTPLEPILTHTNLPLLMSGKFKDGSLVVSTFNLPYHIVNYQNEAEAKLLKNIILSLLPQTEDPGKFSVHRPQPTTITVSTEGNRGISFKENYHPGWKAIVNGQPAPVYKAGLGFMYIPIEGEDQKQTSHVTIEFKGSPATWILPFVSLTGLGVAFLASITTIHFRILGRLYGKLNQKMKDWWARE